ncbi:hypothetical protein AGMMS49936_10950 [Endomicrobiia bacterium]|nr:hypothetical protein AGMMS49936_10950 [Endomicrobiia bacterium]
MLAILAMPLCANVCLGISDIKQGTEVEIDKKTSDQIKINAEQGDAEAQYDLGEMYYNGERVKQDYKKAFYWFKKAAEHENANAQFHLGAMYSKGEGIEQDYKKAFYWFKKAAEQGIDEAKTASTEIIKSRQFHRFCG